MDRLTSILKEPLKGRIIWALRTSAKKYSEIMRELSERDSGKVSHHLRILAEERLVEKTGEAYRLTPKGVEYALYVDSLQLKERYPLPVVLVAILQEGKVLLAKRCREPCKGMWGLPGNEILYGESVEEAAAKEIATELRVHIGKPKLYGSYPTRYSEKGKLLYHVMLFAVRVTAKGAPESGKATGKIEEYGFFSKAELAKLSIIPSNRQPILDAFRQGKQLRAQDPDS